MLSRDDGGHASSLGVEPLSARVDSGDGRNPQLNADGELTHLLTLEGLPADIIRTSSTPPSRSSSIAEREVKKVPLLRGKAVFNLFFENSTRTRTTFEIAAKRLSADVINLNIGASSTSKGETLLDTVDNLVRDGRRHVRRAPFAVGRAAPDRGASERAPGARTCTSSTPATAATRIRRRACSTSTRSAITRRISAS